MEEKRKEEQLNTEKPKKTRSPNSHLKCQKCGNKYPREIISQINGKNYCPTCSSLVLKESERNKELNSLLYEIVGEDKQGMTLLSINIHRAIDKEEFTLAGAIYTLKYIKMMGLWDSITPTNTYFMILKYYKSARDYWIELKHLKDSYSDAYIQSLKDKPVTEVTVNRSDINRDDKKFIEAQRILIYGPEINLDDIEDDDEY